MNLQGNQSIMDVCLANTGSIENLIPLMVQNGITQLDVPVGTNIDIPFELITVDRVASSFDETPATFINIAQRAFNTSFSPAFK